MRPARAGARNHADITTGARARSQAQGEARARSWTRGRRRLSEYRIDHELGRGGMATVHAGWHERLERPVALKVLASHLADNPEFRSRFLREARIAARLHHPSLVRVYDITQVDERPAIVMELLDGDTLVDGRLSRAQAASLADGLAYAHAQ